MPPQNEFHHRHPHRQLLSNQTMEQQLDSSTASCSSSTLSKNELVFQSSSSKSKAIVDLNNWGFPGYLTEEEYVVYVSIVVVLDHTDYAVSFGHY